MLRWRSIRRFHPFRLPPILGEPYAHHIIELRIVVAAQLAPLLQRESIEQVKQDSIVHRGIDIKVVVHTVDGPQCKKLVPAGIEAKIGRVVLA